MIEATLLKKRPTEEIANYNWHATYQYSVNGVQKQYKAYFKPPNIPPLKLHLYYMQNPNRIFSCDEYHWENYKGIVLFPLILLPWILSVIAIFILKIEFPGI